MKIPSWEGKEGFSLQGWFLSFGTIHPDTPSNGGESHFHAQWRRSGAMENSCESNRNLGPDRQGGNAQQIISTAPLRSRLSIGFHALWRRPSRHGWLV